MPLHEGVTWKTLVSYGQMSWWRRGTGDELEEGGTQNYDKISYESSVDLNLGTYVYCLQPINA